MDVLGKTEILKLRVIFHRYEKELRPQVSAFYVNSKQNGEITNKHKS